MPKRKTEQPPPRKVFDPIPLLAGAAIVVLVLAIYRPAGNAGFIWDDNDYVTENETLREARGLVDLWLRPTQSPQWYPLVFTSFWVERHLWKDSPRGYHEVNILLHAASAVLIWRILKFLGVPGAYLAGLIFAVHPVMVESVAWITERKNTLSLLFYLLAARAYLRFATPISNSGLRITDRNYILALVFFVCALLSKSVTASLPAAMVLVLYWKNKRVTMRDVALLAPFFVLGVAAGLHTSFLERTHVGASGPEYQIPFVHRLLIASRAVWFYAGKLVWPINLSFIYPRWQIDAREWWQWLYPAGLIGVLAALLVFRKRIGVGPLVAALFFIGTLFPALGFLNVYPMRYSFVADHFAYHASIGLIVLVAALLARLWIRPGFAKYAPLMGVPVVFMLSIMTIVRAEVFENNGTLFTDVIGKNPGSWMAWQNLAMWTTTTRPADPEARKLAKERLDWAWKLADHVADTNYNLAYAHLADNEAAQAEILFNRAVTIEPRHTNAWIGVARARRKLGKNESAEFALNKAIALKADHPDALYEMGMVHKETNRPDSALEHFKHAVASDPGYVLALREMANIYIAKEDFKQAVEVLERLVARTPNNADNLFDLGSALQRTGRNKEAQPYFQRAIALKPELRRLTKP